MKTRLMNVANGTLVKHTGSTTKWIDGKLVVMESNVIDKDVWFVKTCDAFQYDTVNKKEVVFHPYDLVEIN